MVKNGRYSQNVGKISYIKKKVDFFIPKLDRSWLVQKAILKNSIFFWKIDEIWRILAIFQFLKNITLCGLNRQQFWLEHFFCNSPKNSLKFAKFWQFFKKKRIIFYCKNGSFMVGTKIKKMSEKLEILTHFGHISKIVH